MEKYGAGFYQDMLSLKENPTSTLQGVADIYGISRERIRQFYKLFFKEKYTKAKNIKAEEKKRIFRLGACDPRNGCKDEKTVLGRGTIGEINVLQKAKELGFEVKPACGNRDLNINGHYIEVKTATKIFKMKNTITPKYHFTARKIQLELNDFFIFHINNETKRYFIVPTSEIKTVKAKTDKIAIYINEYRSTWGCAKNKFSEYEDAWHLLQPTNQSSPPGGKNGIGKT